MAPKRAPKQPIPQRPKPGQKPKPGSPEAGQPQKNMAPQVQHKPWSTSVKGGSRGH